MCRRRNLCHAGAANLWIEVVKTADGVEVHATDDGRRANVIQPGHGLTGMRRRLEQLGGHLEINSRHRQGFTINVWMASRGAAP